MESLESLGVNDKYSHCLDHKVLEEYQLRNQLLINQINNKKLIKKSLMLLNEQNENISKGLLQKKKDIENLKTDLSRSLHVLRTTKDKNKIILRKKIDEYLHKKNNFEVLKKSPLMLEVEKLILLNNDLSKEYTKVNQLLEVTKKQYNEMIEHLQKDFQNVLCEFCDMALNLKSPKRTTGE